VNDQDRSVTVPMAESWRVATGLTQAQDEQAEVNLSYELV
jgi:long-chain fatty acid transport protein